MKPLYILFLLSIHFSAFAQVGEAEKLPEKKSIGKLRDVEFYYYPAKEDTQYVIYFRNAEYPSSYFYESISFKGGQEEVNALYKAIHSVFEQENKNNKEYSVVIKVGEDRIYISHQYIIGLGVNARITSPDGHFYLKENQLSKLFGKQ